MPQSSRVTYRNVATRRLNAMRLHEHDPARNIFRGEDSLYLDTRVTIPLAHVDLPQHQTLLQQLDEILAFLNHRFAPDPTLEVRARLYQPLDTTESRIEPTRPRAYHFHFLENGKDALIDPFLHGHHPLPFLQRICAQHAPIPNLIILKHLATFGNDEFASRIGIPHHEHEGKLDLLDPLKRAKTVIPLDQIDWHASLIDPTTPTAIKAYAHYLNTLPGDQHKTFYDFLDTLGVPSTAVLIAALAPDSVVD